MIVPSDYSKKVLELFLMLFLIRIVVCASERNESDSLRLVHVIFRHGYRTNDQYTTYPKDPYLNETYQPYGLGELTNKGKEQVLLLGRALRRRYDNFLGQVYSSGVLGAFTTPWNRSLASLKLVLAGLWSSKDERLNMLIPYESLSFDDKTIAFTLYKCPKYSRLLRDYLNSPTGKNRLYEYAELFQYLSENTGRDVRSIFDVYVIHSSLKMEQEWGFPLPPWTNAVFPERTRKGAIDQYLLSGVTTELKQLSGGFFLKKIIQDMQLKINGTLLPSNRKMFLYSLHEYNIAHLLIALEAFFPHIPPYAACLIIELHQVGDNYGVKIFYRDSEDQPKPLQVDDCNLFCPLTEFVKLLQANLPSSDNACYEDCNVSEKTVNAPVSNSFDC